MQRRVNLLTLFLIPLLLTGCGYNTLQMKEEAVSKAWADIESNLQRRNDLVPNLVETVKGYAGHEKDTLTKVTEARSKASSIQLTTADLGNPAAMKQLQEAQGNLSSALSRLMVVVEKYPDLKANQNFRDLQSQLEGTENRINVARQRYNKAVEDFNASIRVFPANLTNNLLLHLKPKEYFKADAEAKQAPKVKFN